MGVKIIGTGAYPGDRIVTNEEFVEILRENDQRTPLARQYAEEAKQKEQETSPAWIYERTGIKQRRWINASYICKKHGYKRSGFAPEEITQAGLKDEGFVKGIWTSDLVSKALNNAIDDASIDPKDIDFVIYGSLNNDGHFPGLGNWAYAKTKLVNDTPCVDIRQQCMSFLFAIHLAAAVLKSKMADCVAVSTGDLQSPALDFTTRGRTVSALFGDGAGACILIRDENSESDIIDSNLHSNGKPGALFALGYCAATGQPYDPCDDSLFVYNYPFMKGTRIFRRAPMDMANAVKELLERNNLAYNDIKWFLPHQANQNINVLSASILGSEIYQNPGEPIKTTDARWLANIENYGNLSAGTIPILLHDNIKNGNIQRGDLCVTVGFGAGLNWGSVLFRY